MWPIPAAIPLSTPPLGRSHKKTKRTRSSPIDETSPSMTLSPKRLNLNTSLSDSFMTDHEEDDKGSRTKDGFEVTVAKLAERFETAKGRKQKKKKGKK